MFTVAARITTKPQSTHVGYRDTVTFTLSAAGNPRPTVTWMCRDGRELSEDGHIKMRTEGTEDGIKSELTIRGVRREDIGGYTVKVQNSAGEDWAEFKLGKLCCLLLSIVIIKS